MPTILLVAVAGILASLAMASFMYSIHFLGASNGDMIRVLGSYKTRTYERSFGPGMILYLAGGVFFAFLYYFIWQQLGLDGPKGILISGALMGLVHGFIVSFWLVVLVAEHHPLERFRKIGFGVALTYIVGHVIYGSILAFLLTTYARYSTEVSF